LTTPAVYPIFKHLGVSARSLENLQHFRSQLNLLPWRAVSALLKLICARPPKSSALVGDIAQQARDPHRI
jgi:hypothetical protein